jgi:hypothetical protein
MLAPMPRLLTGALVLALLGVIACKDEPAPTAPTATATAAATAPTATAAPQMPEALEVETLTTALGCTKAAHGPCSVLLEFRDCVAWSPVTSSGDGRWMGHGNVVKNGAFTEEITLLRSRRVPTAEVGPGQLGAKIAIQAIPDDRSLELEEANARSTPFRAVTCPDPRTPAWATSRSSRTGPKGSVHRRKTSRSTPPTRGAPGSAPSKISACFWCGSRAPASTRPTESTRRCIL